MNKRIKKKLAKRYGYKWRKNPNIFSKAFNTAMKECFPPELFEAEIKRKNFVLEAFGEIQRERPKIYPFSVFVDNLI